MVELVGHLTLFRRATLFVPFMGPRSHLSYVLSAERGTYSLIGEAYIHGIMHGEAEALRIEPEDFILV